MLANVAEIAMWEYKNNPFIRNRFLSFKGWILLLMPFRLINEANFNE
jgi:hypothetical protein